MSIATNKTYWLRQLSTHAYLLIRSIEQELYGVSDCCTEDIGSVAELVDDIVELAQKLEAVR